MKTKICCSFLEKSSDLKEMSFQNCVIKDSFGTSEVNNDFPATATAFYKVADLWTPHTFSETKIHRWYGSKYLVKPGFGGLIQGQICNPVFSFFLPPFCGVLVGIEQNILQFLLLGWCVNPDSRRGVHPWDPNEKR